jgi:integrase
MENKQRQLQSQGLSREVAKIILASRSSATYKKYELGWRCYSRWCRNKGLDPFTTTVPQVLDYLQFLLSAKALSSETVRGRLYAIAIHHESFPLEQLSQHVWVKPFIKGMKKLYVKSKDSHPRWSLKLVLQTLRGQPFEPPRTLAHVAYKTAFLLAITSAKRIGELQALSIDPRFIKIDATGIRLKLNAKFVPKTRISENREQSLFFTPFCPKTPGSNQTWYTLCVKRAVRRYIYFTRTFRVRGVDQLLVNFQGARKGLPASKPTISRWVRKCIELAYKARGKLPPLGVKAHDTRAVSASWAQFNNASLPDICNTAQWATTNTFALHYQLNLAGNEASARFGNAVLQTVFDDEGRPQ